MRLIASAALQLVGNAYWNEAGWKVDMGLECVR